MSARLAYLDTSAYVKLPLREEGHVLDVATSLSPPTLRTLDALHLATALTVQAEIGAFFTYDQRLREAAAEHGLPVVQPAEAW